MLEFSLGGGDSCTPACDIDQVASNHAQVELAGCETTSQLRMGSSCGQTCRGLNQRGAIRVAYPRFSGEGLLKPKKSHRLRCQTACAAT